MGKVKKCPAKPSKDRVDTEALANVVMRPE